MASIVPPRPPAAFHPDLASGTANIEPASIRREAALNGTGAEGISAENRAGTMHRNVIVWYRGDVRVFARSWKKGP